MDQLCKECIHSRKEGCEEPCNTCDYTDSGTWTNFTPKKDLNQMLREKLGYIDTADAEGNGEVIGYDPVSKPSHYMLKEGLEVRDVLELLTSKITNSTLYPWDTKHLFTSDYVQMMQYLMRFMDKNGKQDLEKARWYLDKLIEAYE